MKLSAMVFDRLSDNAMGEHSIEIYGSAYHFAQEMEQHGFSVANLVDFILSAVDNAKFYEPTLKPSTVARKFCHLVLVDYTLVECFLGIKLTELDHMKRSV